MISRSGFFVLDKRPGVSSARAISDLKRALKITKIGHAGTLDPFATGILVVLVNRATRLASLVAGGEKIYRATFRFGVATDTEDLTGRVIATSPVVPDRQTVNQVLPRFTGTVPQRPPRISAIKIDGKRAYKRARADETFEISERAVEIHQIDVLRLDGCDLELSVRCGSGTYIRSLARDLGEACGSCATVLTLRREATSPFIISEAKPVDQMAAADLICWDVLFRNCRRVAVSDTQADGLSRGDQRIVAELVRDGAFPQQAMVGERIVFELARNSASLGLFEYTGLEWKLQTYMGE